MSRQYANLSSPENVVEKCVENQQLFIMGGYDLSFKMLDDQGYFMYDITTNTMSLVESDNSEDHHLFMKTHNSLNSIKLPIKNKNTSDLCSIFGINAANFRHFIFGGY